MKSEKWGVTGGGFLLLFMFCYCFRVGLFCCDNQLRMCSSTSTGRVIIMGLGLTAQKHSYDFGSLTCLPPVRAPIGKTQNKVNG